MVGMTAPRAKLTTFAWLSIAAAVATIALKFSAYLVTGSVGLLSDAAESIVNLVAAFVALLPSCSVIHSDANLQSMLYDTLTRLSERVPVGELTCLPDDESAIVCHKNIKSIIK